jgi:ArsR family transcriptional regulator
MKTKSYDSFFANFSNATKLGIMKSLMDGPLSVGELVEKIGEEQSNVSHHLQSLTKCKILTVKKNGKQRIYSLNKKTVGPMLGLVERHVDNYCEGNCGGCSGCH